MGTTFSTSTAHADSLLKAFVADYKNGVLAIYSGPRPASADAAETGRLLCLITRDGVAFTKGEAAGGLNFAQPSGGTVNKEDARWSGTILEDGTAGWFRFYDNTFTTGASTKAKRFDGSIGTEPDSALQVTETTLFKGGFVEIHKFSTTMPRSITM